MSKIKLYILLLILVLNSLLSFIWGWKAELLKFKDKFKDGASSCNFNFELSFVIVLVTNFGLIIFMLLLLFLPPLSFVKSMKLFGIFESFSFWITLKGKLKLYSGIGVIILVSWGFGTRKAFVAEGFFGRFWAFWGFENILFWFIFLVGINKIN